MTKIIAHRGSKGTHPENTIAAFEEAIACGADGIELDVHLTKDSHLVVIHDEAIDRTTNGTGQVDSYTLAEIQKFDAGSWFAPEFSDAIIPSFFDVLTLLKEKEYTGLLNIEIKTDEKDYLGIEEKVHGLMESSTWPFTYMFSSFNITTLEKMHALAPSIAKAYIMGTSAKKIKKGLGTDFVDSLHPKVTWVRAQGSSTKKYLKHIRPWTVNEIADIQLCIQLGLAGIHTDFPRKALRYRNLMEGTVSD